MAGSRSKRKKDLARLCGRWSFWKFQGSTATVVPMTCRRWGCSYCAEMMRDQWARWIALSAPERLVTITNPGSTPGGVRKTLQLMVRDVRRQGLGFEYWGVTELTKVGRPHLHLLQRGDYISNKMLYHFALTHGAGFIDIRRISSGWTAARYCSKHLTHFHGRPAFRRRIRYSRKFFPDEVKAEMHSTSEGWSMVDLIPRHAATLLAILAADGNIPKPERWEIQGAELYPELGDYDLKLSAQAERRIRMLCDPDLFMKCHEGNYPLREEV